MLDKTLPYFNIIMKRLKGTEFPKVILPDGFSFSSFVDGDEIYWAEIETSIGEFDNVEEALNCFRNEYLTNINELKKRLIFIQNKEGKKVGTLTNWWNYSQGVRDPSIHWVGIIREFQGLGLGKAIVFEGMRRMIELEGDRDLFLHTQTWSYKAINIYIQAGYKIVNDETFGDYINESEKAMPIIRDKIDIIKSV